MIEEIIRKIVAEELVKNNDWLLAKIKSLLAAPEKKEDSEGIEGIEYLPKKEAAKLISVSVSALELYIREGDSITYYVRGKRYWNSLVSDRIFYFAFKCLIIIYL